ncbi:MAG TPA: class I SAM-dependent methyltransferase [Gammaproteobacteria bacterium]|nr:class I SAM-dependent methyltransferase [Gammaproteobacteria bacterium]
METEASSSSFKSSLQLVQPQDTIAAESTTAAQHQLLEITTHVAAQLRQLLGRPLRVVDLGCDDGLFSLQLACEGDEVIGADSNQAHILTCQARAKELGLTTTFVTADISNWQNCGKSFDLALAFNLTQLSDLTKIEKTVQALSQRATIALITSSWQNTQENTSNPLPANPFQLLRPYAYLEKLTEYPSSVTDIKNPVFFCSNAYWYAKGAMQRFDYWTEQSRQRFEKEVHNNIYPHRQTRRYYFNDTRMLKHYRLTGDKIKSNRNEIQAEINFINNNMDKINTLPRMQAYNISEDDAWMLREKFSGIRLSCAISDGMDYDPKKILVSILQQLALFERHGFYQNDLRPWNFILSENDTIFLIDYGTVSQTPRDSLSRKKSVFMSFLVLAHEIIYRKVLLVRQFSPVFISPRYFPDNYATWLYHLLSTDFSQWSFALFLELLDRKELPDRHSRTAANNMLLWLDEIDQHLGNPKFKMQHFQKYFIKKLHLEVTKAGWKSKLTTFVNKFLLLLPRFNQKPNPELE